MGTITLNNLRVYAYHGCLEEEGKIGGEYRVDLSVNADLEKASKTDKLKDTVDYVGLNKVVIEEMTVRSKLLETVASRILCRVLKEFDEVKEVSVAVTKINPPLGGDVESVSVKMSKSRNFGD